MKWGQGHVYYFYESEMVTPCAAALGNLYMQRYVREKKQNPDLNQ